MNSPDELNPHKFPTDGIIDSNLLVLYGRLKQVEALWLEAGGEAFHVNSGLRSNKLQEQLIAEGKSAATHSRHLIGAAADISDPEGKLKAWLKEKPEILEQASLWCEAAEYTTTWCHFQIIPPGSGHRWFVP